MSTRKKLSAKAEAAAIVDGLGPQKQTTWDSKTMRFVGDGRRTKAQTQANRYVYAVLGSMLEHEKTDRGGWIFDGIENEFDIRRLRIAIDRVQKQLARRAR